MMIATLKKSVGGGRKETLTIMDLNRGGGIPADLFDDGMY